MLYRRHRVSSKALSRSALLNSTSQSPRPNAQHASRLARSMQVKGHQDRSISKDDYEEYRAIYNGNVSKFRDIFNSNDNSQVPFMSSLRSYPKTSESRRSSMSPRLEEAARPTANQLIRKRVGDFKTKSSLLAPVYFRWHNKSGRNNLWSTDFQCSLRDYGHNPEQKRYDPMRQPIVYKDVQLHEYAANELICPRQQRTFRIKRE